MFDKGKLRILLAIDFSLSSRTAFNTLKLIQKKYKTDAFLIHVVDSFWKNWNSSGLYEKEAMQRLQHWQKKFSRSVTIKKMYVKVGNPADNIIEESHKIKANLIVLGGKVSEESSRYKTGVTIESVVRSATKSVWICRKDKISKILCGIDGSPSSRKALQFAIELSRQYSAKLCIIHALPSYLPAFGMPERTVKKDEEKFKIEYTNKINKFLGEFNFKKVKYQLLAQWGVPANILLDHAEDYGFDLIIIGAKGHSILHHVLLGSTAEKILRHSPCSLLVAR